MRRKEVDNEQDESEDERCDCNDCLDERNPTRQRSGEWAGTGIMTNDIGPLP